MQHARIHMRAHELSLVIHISIKVCCVFGDRLVCLLLVLRGEEDETKWETPWNWVSKHTHTYTHTCCLLPAQATKWGVPFSLIMAAVRVTWATHSRAVGEKKERAPGALADPEQHRTGTNYIALICLFQHLLIKSHSRGPGRSISMTDLYVDTDAEH